MPQWRDTVTLQVSCKLVTRSQVTKQMEENTFIIWSPLVLLNQVRNLSGIPGRLSQGEGNSVSSNVSKRGSETTKALNHV